MNETTLNIISSAACTTRVGGPWKVFRNLVKGLDQIGCPYSVNAPIASTTHVLVHDTVAALRHTRPDQRVLVGPNIFLDPSAIPSDIDLTGRVFLQPCEWARVGWLAQGFDVCPIHVWPVGIDTAAFGPIVPADERKTVVVMYKDWQPAVLHQLNDVVAAVRACGHEPVVLTYGEYEEEEYVRVLHSALMIVWYGRVESQGIGLLEALSCDVPMVAVDMTRPPVGRDNNGRNSDLVTSTAPYFDERCGVKVASPDDIPDAVQRILVERDRWAPRQFILQNLTLDRQAAALLAIWAQYWDEHDWPVLGLSAPSQGDLDSRVWPMWELGNAIGQSVRRRLRPFRAMAHRFRAAHRGRSGGDRKGAT